MTKNMTPDQEYESSTHSQKTKSHKNRPAAAPHADSPK